MLEEQWHTGEITMSIGTVPLTMTISIPAFPVKPWVMLPVFQQMANRFTEIAEKVAAAKNEHISCRKGCGACCRQSVPLAEIEVYHITQLVERMPEPRRSEIRQRFDAAVSHFHNTGWYQRFERAEDDDEMNELAFEYFVQGIPCPFLEDESCSIHPDRPIACREYLVTTPSERCSDPRDETIGRLELPTSAATGTRKVGRSKNMAGKNFTYMIFALMYTKQHPEQFAEKTGAEWLGEFFGAGV